MDEVLEAYDALLTLEYRRHLPTVALNASVNNLTGGKGDGTGPPPDLSKIYTPMELLPPYAIPSGEEDSLDPPYPCSPALARGVIAAHQAHLIREDNLIKLAPRYRAILARASR